MAHMVTGAHGNTISAARQLLCSLEIISVILANARSYEYQQVQSLELASRGCAMGDLVKPIESRQVRGDVPR